jgi:hypothetical protein
MATDIRSLLEQLFSAATRANERLATRDLSGALGDDNFAGKSCVGLTDSGNLFRWNAARRDDKHDEKQR